MMHLQAHAVLVEMVDKQERRLPAVLAQMQSELRATGCGSSLEGAEDRLADAAPTTANNAALERVERVADSRGDIGYWFQRAATCTHRFDTGDIVQLREGLLHAPTTPLTS